MKTQFQAVQRGGERQGKEDSGGQKIDASRDNGIKTACRQKEEGEEEGRGNRRHPLKKKWGSRGALKGLKKTEKGTTTEKKITEKIRRQRQRLLGNGGKKRVM